MPVTTTNVDVGNVLLAYGEFRDYTLTGTANDVIAEGTILSRHTTTNNLQLYVKGGSANGNGVPSVLLTYPVTIPTGGSIQVRGLISGVVRLERLIIDADGNASGVDNLVIDGLRTFGITPINVFELLIPDNQP